MQVSNETMKNEDDSRAKQIQHGTHLIQATNVVAKLPMKINDIDSKLGISAQKWSIEQYVGQKQLLASLSNVSLEAQPYQWKHSWKNVRTLLGKFAPLFRNWTWKTHLRFEIQSIFQEQGMDMIYFSNCDYPGVIRELFGSDIEVYNLPLASIWQLPHRKIILGENVDVEFDLNWISPYKGAFDDNSYNNGDGTLPDDYSMGSIVYRNIEPIKVATGVAKTRNVRIWISFGNIEYSGYNPTQNL